MCASPQIVHEQLDGMRDLIFDRHIFTDINVRGARSMRVWMMISKRVYKMKKVRSVTFFFFVDQIPTGIHRKRSGQIIDVAHQ